MSDVENKEVVETAVAEGDGKEGATPEKEDGKEPPIDKRLVRLGDGIEIYADKPLPKFDRGTVKAFEAKDKKDNASIAIICDRAFVPRREYLKSYGNIDIPYLPNHVGHGKVYWPPEKREVYVFVYENIFGEPFVGDDKNHAMNMKESFVSQKLVPSLISIVEALDASKIVHGSLSLEVLYGEGSEENLLKGKHVTCLPALSVPAFYGQNPTYLPIEKCFCDSLGAGEGSVADDLYAIGAIIACALRRTDPLKGMSRIEVARHKMENSSYHAIVGEGRLTGSLLELVRGLLMDDPSQRWTLADIQTWRDGQRVNVKHGKYKRHKSKRPMEFSGGKYLRPELLISAMSEDMSESIRIIENDQLGQWIDRALADKTVKLRVGKAEETLAGASSEEASQMRVSFVMAALSETMPLYYRKLRLMPQSLGNMMAHDFAKNLPMNSYNDLIKSLLPKFWSETSALPEAESQTLFQKLRSAQAALKQKGIGYGAERALYILSSDAPCYSSAYEKYYVTHPEDLLSALDDMCLKGNAPPKIIDRHVAAFLSVRDRQCVDSRLIDLNSNDPQKHASALLQILSSLQRRTNSGPVEGVTAWFVDNVAQSLVEVYANRELRETVLVKLEKIKHRGKFDEISALLDNPYEVEKDKSGFANAHHDYVATQNEISTLKTIFEKKLVTGAGRGREIAAMVSSLIAAAIILLTILSRFTDISIF